jgi:hypothetical protein
MHSLKGSSARECNLILSRTGQFWEHESFDHFVRAGKFYPTIKYVLNNPVKARLVNTGENGVGTIVDGSCPTNFSLSISNQKSLNRRRTTN